MTPTLALKGVVENAGSKLTCPALFPRSQLQDGERILATCPRGFISAWKRIFQRWREDSYPYPPYQYRSLNLLIDRNGAMRLPGIEEKEYMMGFPAQYTQNCFPKAKKVNAEHLDFRHSLIGNTWCVPAIIGSLGICPAYSLKAIVDPLDPLPADICSILVLASATRLLWGHVSEPGLRLPSQCHEPGPFVCEYF